MESGNYFANHTYIMTSTEETCPVCFESYGLHEDGSFLCKDGVSNSGLEGYTCQHYLCIKCWDRMYQREIYNCPLCRENLKIWMIIRMIPHIGNGEREQAHGHDDEYDDEAAQDAGERYRIERDQAEREREYDEELRREARVERNRFRGRRH
jgi:hypothetical protein